MALSVMVKTNWNYKQYIKLWIDFSNNGDLEDAGELVYDQKYTINNTTYTFTVPPTAFNAPVRIRMIMVYNNMQVLYGNNGIPIHFIFVIEKLAWSIKYVYVSLKWTNVLFLVETKNNSNLWSFFFS